MKNFIRHIRQQPKSVRNNYALGFSIALTSVVALIWLASLTSFDAASITTTNEAESKQTPFATLFKQTKEQLASLGSVFGSPEIEVAKENSVEAEPINPLNITITDEDRQLLDEREVAASTSTSTLPTYTEVLIGTTTSGSL